MRYLKDLIKFIIFYSKHLNVKFKIKRNTKLNHETILEGNNSIGYNSNIISTELGFATYIGDNCYFPSCKLGRYCSIASNINIIIGNHPTHTFVSTHPSFFSKKKQAGFTFVQNEKFNEVNWVDKNNKILVEIGNDVWIGNDVKILSGITIGDGAIVAAGSVVTKDVVPYSIVGGIPAKVIRNRFSPENEKFLMDIKWWNWNYNKIEELSDYFEHIEELKKKLKNT